MGSRFDYDNEKSIIAVVRSLVERHRPDSGIEVVPIGMDALRRLVVELDAQPAQRVRGSRPTATVRILARLVDGVDDKTGTISMPAFKARELLDYIESLESNLAGSME